MGEVIGERGAPKNAPDVALTAQEVSDFLDEVFPQIHAGGRSIVVEAVGPMTSQIRLLGHERHLRPGGTVSGPAMMMLADLSLYVAILGQIGKVPLAVTTNLSFNFLRKPEPGDLIAECRLLKLGRSLAMGEVNLRAEGRPEIVCHATGTYSIPPRSNVVS